MTEIPLVCLLGATGTGKTAAALALAQSFDGEVINFDSRQVYAGLAVVTAQPTASEQALCPHFLYGYLPVSEAIRAGAFCQEIRTQAHACRARGRIPILVGGTGLYLKSLLEGLAPIPDIDPGVRAEILKECQELGSAVLYARLQGIDPDYAARIHPNDPQRICRALEVFQGTGQTISWWHAHTMRPTGLRALKIGLPAQLESLPPRLETRILQMLEGGAVQEVETAYAIHPVRTAPGFSGIGCPEILSVLLDGQTLEQARQNWLRNTRAYAKRQLTWFRKERDIFWHVPEDVRGMIRRVEAFLGLTRTQ